MDLRNNFIKKSVIEALCDMNYDKNLTEASKQIKPPEHHFLTNFWKESGSFDTVRQIREVAKWQLFEAMPEVAQLQQVFDAVLQNGAEFKRQFQELLPMEDRAIDTVFSHNDFQENNMMLKDSDYSKIVLIDFEFSCLNNRGFDLATYYLEAMITYKHMGQLPFKVYYDWCMHSHEVDAMLQIYLHRYFLKFYGGKQKWHEFFAQELPILREQFQRCVLINNVLWAFSCLLFSEDPGEDPAKAMRFAGMYLYAFTRLEIL